MLKGIWTGIIGGAAAWGAAALGAGAETVPLTVTDAGGARTNALPGEVALAFPGEAEFYFHAPEKGAWLAAERLRLELVWPEGAPAKAGALAWLKDRDHYWHQYMVPGNLEAGRTNVVEIPFAAGAAGWQAPGHSVAWHHRVRLDPQSVGVRVYADGVFTGRCVLVSAALETRAAAGAPGITRVRALTREPRVRACYELGFDLPDRYANPFDPAQIDAGAVVTGPDGTARTAHAFYYQPHYRLEDELGEPVEPDGPPEWRVRYCPLAAGEHTVTLYARDALGETVVSNALRFAAAEAAADALRFVRVSERDRRYFEFDDGTLFYPVGHNTRSATDARMDDKFPWTFRKEEGSTAYRRYFKRMQDAGENMAEVWMSAWSLGLEWTEGIGGYHGANDYHMGNAWELDRVVELAMAHRIYINLVLNYHGRISTWCDPEWHLHPYNAKTPGGWLGAPLEFFSDGRAVEMQRRFCRYTHARWGWAPVVFGYELCSELNLTGHETHHKTHFEAAVVEWCRVLGAYVKSIDPYGHLVSAHVSNDYKFLNPALCEMPEMDFNPLDAYHHTVPERIVGLAAETADAGAAYNKPILITEFGGSPMAAGLEHLKVEHHAALWAGACVPLAGLPMFWWWQVVDEHDLYGRYAAVKAFMADVDPRDPSAKRVKVAVAAAEAGDAKVAGRHGAVATASAERARGYVHPKTFPRGEARPAEVRHLTVAFENAFTPGLYRAVFHETEKGAVTRRFDVRVAEDGKLVVPVPPFRRDCAFKVSLLTPAARR